MHVFVLFSYVRTHMVSFEKYYGCISVVMVVFFAISSVLPRKQVMKVIEGGKRFCRDLLIVLDNRMKDIVNCTICMPNVRICVSLSYGLRLDGKCEFHGSVFAQVENGEFVK